jgi:hypothetical protein
VGRNIPRAGGKVSGGVVSVEMLILLVLEGAVGFIDVIRADERCLETLALAPPHFPAYGYGDLKVHD